MNDLVPDNWVVIEIIGGEDNRPPVYKVFASWIGGYLDGDSWKLNSGISKVTEDGDYILFHGYSGSCYKCHKKGWGRGTSYHTNILSSILNKAESAGYVINILPKDTNFIDYEYINNNDSNGCI